jgi:uncharacterized glyoxalase superfamily protein PhnB
MQPALVFLTNSMMNDQLRASAFTARAAIPTFLVSDIASVARWYAENLGFHLAGSVPKVPPFVYASLVLGNIEIMMLSLDRYEKPDLRPLRPAGLWDAYIRCDGVATLYESVKEATFVQSPLQQRPYGDWEFEVRDPNGYVLVFGGTR